MINKKKISGILQENISILGKKFLIVGIGINLVKNPKLINYPTTNLFELINKNLTKTFAMFFNGGKSYLKLWDKENPLESNIEIIAKPPGKKNKTLNIIIILYL